MEALVQELTKKESIVKALSEMPIATTGQLAMLFNSNKSPLKKASQHLQELLQEKMIEWEWYQRQKLWRLSKKALSMMELTRTKIEHIDHTLAIGDIYFTLRPSHWLFEPVIEFDYYGKKHYWDPDCVFKADRRYAVCEVQLSSLSETKWKKKWDNYNKYFEQAFKKGPFQEWADGKIVLPRFIAMTTNKKAAEGFAVSQRELIITRTVEDILEVLKR